MRLMPYGQDILMMRQMSIRRVVLYDLPALLPYLHHLPAQAQPAGSLRPHQTCKYAKWLQSIGAPGTADADGCD